MFLVYLWFIFISYKSNALTICLHIVILLSEVSCRINFDLNTVINTSFTVLFHPYGKVSRVFILHWAINSINGDIEPLSLLKCHSCFVHCFTIFFCSLPYWVFYSFLLCWMLRGHKLFSQINLGLNFSFTPVSWGILVTYFSQLADFLKITLFWNNFTSRNAVGII